MIKNLAIVLFLVMMFTLAGCTYGTPEKYKVINENIKDIDVKEVNNYGVEISITMVNGKTFYIGLPDGDCHVTLSKRHLTPEDCSEMVTAIPTPSDTVAKPTLEVPS